jgi:Rrf2 family protein
MARHPQTVSNARQIAERYGVPAALLSKVLKVLAQQEIVRSIRGVKGGYLLALPAEEISLASVIEAIEGPVRFVQCAGDQDGEDSICELTAHCPVTRPIQKVHRRLTELLEDITLADLVFDAECATECVAVSVEGQAVETEPLT